MRRTADGRTTWDVRKESHPSDWMDPSHVKWFASVLEEFALAIARREFVGADAVASHRCVELIEAAYESARLGSREVSLVAPQKKSNHEPTVGLG